MSTYSVRAVIVSIVALLCFPVDSVAQVAIDWSDTGMLITDAEVAGVRAAALVDTGHVVAGVDEMTIQTSLKDVSSKVVQGTGVFSRREARCFENVPVSIERLGSQNGQAIDIDPVELVRMRAVSGKDGRHIVGMSFLANYTLEFRPPTAIIKSQVAVDQHERTWPLIDNAAKMPKIRCTLGRSTSFSPVLDTGLMGWLVLRRELAEELLHSGEAVEAMKAGQVEPGNPPLLIVRTLNLWGTDYKNVPAFIGVVDLIGFGVLSQMQLTLDFPNNRVIVPDPPQPGCDWFPLDASGIRIVRSEDKSIVIRRLVPKSNGENAGLHVGDKVLSVDGTQVEDLVCTEIRENLSQAGKTVVLEIERDGQRQKISVPLTHPFEYPPKWPPRKALTQDQLDFQKFLEEQDQKSPNN